MRHFVSGAVSRVTFFFVWPSPFPNNLRDTWIKFLKKTSNSDIVMRFLTIFLLAVAAYILQLSHFCSKSYSDVTRSSRFGTVSHWFWSDPVDFISHVSLGLWRKGRGKRPISDPFFLLLQKKRSRCNSKLFVRHKKWRELWRGFCPFSCVALPLYIRLVSPSYDTTPTCAWRSPLRVLDPSELLSSAKSTIIRSIHIQYRINSFEVYHQTPLVLWLDRKPVGVAYTRAEV